MIRIFKAVYEDNALAKMYALDQTRYKVVDNFRYKGQDMLLQEAKDGTGFCVQYCGSGHYFDTFEEAQSWAVNRTKGLHRFIPTLER